MDSHMDIDDIIDIDKLCPEDSYSYDTTQSVTHHGSEQKQRREFDENTLNDQFDFQWYGQPDKDDIGLIDEPLNEATDDDPLTDLEEVGLEKENTKCDYYNGYAICFNPKHYFFETVTYPGHDLPTCTFIRYCKLIDCFVTNVEDSSTIVLKEKYKHRDISFFFLKRSPSNALTGPTLGELLSGENLTDMVYVASHTGSRRSTKKRAEKVQTIKDFSDMTLGECLGVKGELSFSFRLNKKICGESDEKEDQTKKSHIKRYFIKINPDQKLEDLAKKFAIELQSYFESYHTEAFLNRSYEGLVFAGIQYVTSTFWRVLLVKDNDVLQRCEKCFFEERPKFLEHGWERRSTRSTKRTAPREISGSPTKRTRR